MVVIARDYYRAHRWDLAKYALQAILDGADDGSIPPRDKGNAGRPPPARAHRARVRATESTRLVDFQQAVARRPDLFEAYINLGEMKLEAGNATEAQGPLERAVRVRAERRRSRTSISATATACSGAPGDAKKEFDKAPSAWTRRSPGVHYDLGLLYLFSPNVPGVSGPDDQLAKAIQELETYRSMRSAKAAKGPGDDVDELLSTAKRKQSELQLKKQAAAAPPPGAPPRAAVGLRGARASRSPRCRRAARRAGRGSLPRSLRRQHRAGAAQMSQTRAEIPMKRNDRPRWRPVRRSHGLTSRGAGQAPHPAKPQQGVLQVGEITIVGRVQKPIAAVDVAKIQPKLTLAELRQPFLDRIEEAVRKDPF